MHPYIKKEKTDMVVMHFRFFIMKSYLFMIFGYEIIFFMIFGLNLQVDHMSFGLSFGMKS